MKRFFRISSLCIAVVGILLIFGGVWGIKFSYDNVAREKITTPEDASISDTSVRGPLTLLTQSETIRKHVLERTKGKTYAEVPQQESELRSLWITALTLITALNLGVVAYIISGLALFIGIFVTWTGIMFYLFVKKLDRTIMS